MMDESVYQELLDRVAELDYLEDLRLLSRAGKQELAALEADLCEEDVKYAEVPVAAGGLE